ncbi:MAG: protein kinase [bacterium]|nr:protein kinase [bacterium]
MAISLRKIEGKYEILEKIREGGMGAVYKVRHRLLGDVRVVKVMRPQFSRDASLRKRFHREAKAVTRLTHPNIAQLYDFTLDDEGTAYIVMEFIQGLSLDELIAHGELVPVGLALEIAGQALKAIGHIHKKGVIHRDISPDNLMLTRDVDRRGVVKLIDLGLAKVAEGTGQLTASGVFLGKFRYASPEQFGHGSDVPIGPYSDLYSFGLVFYELLTGRFPILGNSPSSLIAGHLFRSPLDFADTDPEGRVPDDLRRVVGKALSKDYRERFAGGESFAAALAPIRRRYDLSTPEVERILDLTLEEHRPPRRIAPTAHESTQSRFDQHFSREPTPLPSRVGASEALEPTRIMSRPAPPPPLEPQAPESMIEEEPAAEEGLGEVTRQIETLIAEGEFDTARQELAKAVEARGELPELLELAERIEEIEQIARRPEVRELLREARREAGRENFPAALQALGKAAELAPGDEQVQTLLEETQRAARRHQAELTRHQVIQERVRQIEQLLDRGQIEEASAALRLAGERYGKSFAALEARLDDVERRRDRDLRVEPLVREAEELRAADRLGEALLKAQEAMKLKPVNKRIQVLVFELEQEVAEHQRLEERGKAKLAAEEKIRDLVERGEFEEASRRLPDALDVAGPTLVLKALQEQVRKGVEEKKPESKARSRQRRADELVTRARSLAQTEEFAEARDLLAAALEICPDHPEGLTLMVSVETCHKLQDEEVEVSVGVDRTVTEIRRCLDGGQIDTALKDLENATRRFGDHRELRELRYEAVEAQLDEETGTRSFAATATREPSLPDAGETAPGTPEGDSPAVTSEIPVGDHVPAVEMPSRTASADESPSEPGPGHPPEATAPPETSVAEQRSFDEISLSLKTETIRPEAMADLSYADTASPPSEAPPDETVPEARELPWDSPLKTRVLPVGEVPSRRPPPLDPSSRGMLIIGAAVVVVFVLLGLFLRTLVRPGDEPETHDVAVGRPGSGAVAIDAIPWAEITRIVDQDGKGHAPYPTKHTPVLLRLDPGTYRITLRCPSPRPPEEITVEIPAEAPSVPSVTCQKIDSKQYFLSMGSPADGEPSPRLVEAAEAFLSGEYDKTINAASQATFTRPKARAHAELLRAAAHYADYLLDGERAADVKELAAESVRACRRADRSVEPVDAFFSPRFREFFARPYPTNL